MTFRRPIDDTEMRNAKDDIGGRFSTNVDTICDHIRVIYAIGKKVSDTSLQLGIMNECLIVMIYAKRMSNKSTEFNKGRGVVL